MCEPTTIAVIGLAVAAAGAYTSYSAGQNAASAAESAQNQANASQNMAFNARMEGQREQLASQTDINNRAAQDFQTNQAAQQDDQNQAMDARQAKLADINDQEQVIASRADQAVSQGVQGADAANLAQAQTDQIAQQQAMDAPAEAQVQASNPLGGETTGVTKDAMDARDAGASRFVTQYGDSLARLSSYSAPVALATRQATTIGTNLMPAAAADALVRNSAPALLGPSATAYQQAGSYGTAVKQANALSTQGALNVAANAAGNTDALANLQQSDDAARIQGDLSVTQAKAARLAALGQGLSAIGNAGVSYAGSQGAFKGLGGKISSAVGLGGSTAAAPAKAIG